MDPFDDSLPRWGGSLAAGSQFLSLLPPSSRQDSSQHYFLGPDSNQSAQEVLRSLNATLLHLVLVLHNEHPITARKGEGGGGGNQRKRWKQFAILKENKQVPRSRICDSFCSPKPPLPTPRFSAFLFRNIHYHVRVCPAFYGISAKQPWQTSSLCQFYSLPPSLPLSHGFLANLHPNGRDPFSLSLSLSSPLLLVGIQKRSQKRETKC